MESSGRGCFVAEASSAQPLSLKEELSLSIRSVTHPKAVSQSPPDPEKGFTSLKSQTIGKVSTVPGRRRRTGRPSAGHTEQAEHGVAPAGDRCHPTVALQVLALSACPPLRRAGRADAGPLYGLVARPASWPQGPRPACRRADQPPGPDPAVIPPCPPQRVDRPLSRTPTSAGGPCHSWPPGRCAEGT